MFENRQNNNFLISESRKKDKTCLKVIFQSMNPLLFRATFIGYLYEIAQRHQVVLLTGKVDFDTKKILDDKIYFLD